MCFFALLILSSVAFCASREDLENATGIMGNILSMIDDIFGENEGWGGLRGAKKLLTIKISASYVRAGDFSLSSNMVSALKTVTDIFKSIGLTMVIIYFLSSLLDDVQFQQSYPEKMVKKFIMLFVAWAFVMNADTLVYLITNAGSSLVAKVYQSTSATAFNVTRLKMDLYDSLNVEAEGGWIDEVKQDITNKFEQMGVYMMMFIPWVVCKAAGVVVALGCWSRFIEVMIYAIVSPLTVSDIAKGSIERSSATKGIKNIMALSLSGAVIMLTLYLGREIQLSIISDFATSLGAGYDHKFFTSAMFSEVVVAVVEAGVISRAGSISKQALGVV